MASDSGQKGFIALLTRARVAILALAPDEGRLQAAAPDADTTRAWAGAGAGLAEVLARLEHQDDPLRALLAVDMALAMEGAGSEMGCGVGRLVALLEYLPPAPPPECLLARIEIRLDANERARSLAEARSNRIRARWRLLGAAVAGAVVTAAVLISAMVVVAG